MNEESWKFKKKLVKFEANTSIYIIIYTILAMKKRHLRLGRVSVSVFVGWISTDISDRFLNNKLVLVYSCREFQVLREYAKIFKSQLGTSANIKPPKTEIQTPRRWRHRFLLRVMYLRCKIKRLLS